MEWNGGSLKSCTIIERIMFVLSKCDEQLPVSDFDQALQTIDRVIERQY